jgi:Tol biopolymer transport system component
MSRVVASIVFLCLATLALAAPASSQAPTPPAPQFDRGIPVPVAGRAPDSDAPPGSAPHWLPHDMWVHLHWVPFDEARLQKLLHSSRRALWQWLRNDVQTLAELGAKHGYTSPRTLAAALVAPRAKDVSPEMLRELRTRTLRVLVQGHLSQHLIFHSLHQEAGPDAAAELFGVKDTESFQRLRRLDLSPLRIGRTHGRTRRQMQSGLERELRMAAREGVEGGDTSPRQAQIVLQRQLRQVPRWLGEDHYNGPPQTTGGKLRYPFRGSFASPVLSGDGRVVLFDAQQPAPPLAVRYGEVVLEGRDLRTGAQLDPRDASVGALLDRPCSSYGPSLSSDATKIAYEISAGNRTYAKRYGNVVVAVADTATGSVRVVAGGYDGSRVETAYDPTLSDDGNVVAYQSVIADPMSPSTSWATRVRVRELRDGASAPVSTVPRAGAYDATVSGDGRVVGFTSYSRNRLQVFVYDRVTRKVTLVSRIGGRALRAAEAWEPSLSHNGRRIAFTATRTAGGRARVYVRELRERTSRAVSGSSRGFAHEPSISANGRRVAYAELPGGGGQSPAGRPAQRVLVRDLAGGSEQAVSEGATRASWSGQPHLSGDGLHVAYTTDAGVAAGGGPGGLRVMVADLAARTVTTASPRAPMGSFDTAPALRPGVKRLCALAPPAW